MIRDKEGKNHESIPYHKRTLLDAVTKLYIVNASSRIPVHICFMRGHPRKSDIDIPLDKCRADRLGQMDLDGWILADRVSRLAKLNRWHHAILFKHMKSIAFGAWDDGRWRQYRRGQLESPWDTESELEDLSIHPSLKSTTKSKSVKNGGVSTQEPCVSPIWTIRTIVERIFHRARLEDIRGHGRNSVDNLDRIEGRVISHEASLDDYYHYPGQKSMRVYTTTKAFGDVIRGYSESLGGLALVYNVQDNFVLNIRPVDDSDNSDDLRSPIGRYKPMTPDLEFCITSEIAGDKQQLQFARGIKEALENFRQRDESTKEYAEEFLGKFKILVGDEVPPCPCCGSTR